jgi:hypothetical protein
MEADPTDRTILAEDGGNSVDALCRHQQGRGDQSRAGVHRRGAGDLIGTASFKL